MPPPERPFALAADVKGGRRLAALNAAAEAAGLRLGDTVADARVKAVDLVVADHDPGADRAGLRRLGLWAMRYSPVVALFGPEEGEDGLFLDITGAAHLHGGEAGLIDDLARRLVGFGLAPELALAGTPGAAWAVSRFHPAPGILRAGREAQVLAPLPVKALRLDPDLTARLRRLGLKTIGAIAARPRAPFAARFEAALLRRLDQATGRLPEPLDPIVPAPAYRSLRRLLEPIARQEAVVVVARDLMADLAPTLERDGVAARRLRLDLYRVDGGFQTLEIGVSAATRDPDHFARLVDLKLDRAAGRGGDGLDAGFGFEAVGLSVVEAAPWEARQEGLEAAEEPQRAARCAALMDGLRQRLGARSVRRPVARQSHLPERAEAFVATEAFLAADAGAASAWTAGSARPRPILVFPRPEPAEVVALVPEGPPQRFRWRGGQHRIARAEGPERIAGEWWRATEPPPTRDYYLVEDAEGRRFWLYREGLYGRETASPRWFVQGLFA
ncbi:DNA polymerase Y family protein [Rhizobiales bacterium Sp-1]|uniref:DNA polymerase Y family protein n=1 Tax=Segnochrobactrum spirostomi TaxID=2608987 RepID=A0A6A7Y1B4_9HYPH|nr:DNA polymerase Y family protein [Segnochrobactrum spirostomi]